MWKSALIATWTVLAGPVLRAADIDWRTDYAQARKESKESGKPLLAYFTTDNCLPCLQMQETLRFHANKISLDFVPVKITTHSGMNKTDGILRYYDDPVAVSLKINEYPVTVVAKPDGTILHKLKGPQDPTAFGTLLSSVPRQRLESPAATRRAQGKTCSVPCSCKECWCDHTGQSCATTGKPCMPMGVDPSKLAKEETRWFGAEPTKGGSFFGEAVPDWSKLGFITVFARDLTLGETVAKAIGASKFNEHFRVNTMDAASPLAKGFKLDQDEEFKRTGLKIVVQDSPETLGGFGKELASTHEWTSLEAFEREFGRVDPRYDPNKKPAAPGTSGIGPGLILAGCGLFGLCVMGLVLLLLPSAATEESDELQYAT